MKKYSLATVCRVAGTNAKEVRDYAAENGWNWRAGLDFPEVVKTVEHFKEDALYGVFSLSDARELIKILLTIGAWEGQDEHK